MKKIFFLLLLSSLLFNNCANKTRMLSSTSGMPAAKSVTPKRVEILFLGHKSEHHNSEKYAPILASALFKNGINLSYTADLNDLNPENLQKYDGLIIYANHDTISPSQEKAVIDFVEGGKGLVPIHCASWCFRNSEQYIKTVGGQFKTHKTGTFTAKITNASHPVMQGISEFETWDETYVHSKLNPDITVLMERTEGNNREPWTWVRNQGKGRVFYTAYGHDERTWTQPGFLRLIQNGILWSINDEAREQLAKLDIPEGVYSDADIPNYEKRDPPPRFQHAFTAEQSQKLIQVPVDFEIELFASEPNITNPIAMAWDERGRLWVIETVDYPNTVRNKDGEGADRIKICEDTDGDGKADKFTVFADKLNIPTSIVFANGGVIVAQAPHFLFLKDTDGDDKADVREIIMSGWGKSDTHAGPSNLKYGFDNKIWGVLGYSGFDGKIGGRNYKFSQGVYHFTPDGKSLDYLARTSNNTWGLGFSEEFDVFISTANNTHSAFFSMPARYMKRTLAGLTAQPVQKIDGHYDMHVVFPNLRQVDVHGGFTAAAGHSLYTARNFPKSYWNRVGFVCEPTGRLVHQAILERNGSGFIEKDGWNFLASSDEWVGPVQAEVGPDGAVWIADWYDFIIQHNPTPRGFENGAGNAYINPLRDSERGRIYRIKYKNAKPYTPIKLSKEDTEGLLSALKNDNMFWRMTAQRLLVESQNRAAIPGLYQIISDQKVDEIGLNSPAVHALWTLHGLGALNGTNPEALQVVARALSHPAAAVRKTAIQVLPKNQQTLGFIQNSRLMNDPDLRVRLALALALADMPAAQELGELVYRAALDPENAKDEYIAQALYAAALTHQKGFLAAAQHTGSMHRMSDLTHRIAKNLAEEVYTLERRSSLLFPPELSGKEIIIRSTITKGQRDLEGVVVAQGGQENGYVVYIQDGKIHMQVNQEGKIYKAVSSGVLPEKFDLTAKLLDKGVISIEVDGKPVAKGKAAALFTQTPPQMVRVSYDFNDGDKIGTYDGAFPLFGNMQNSSLELKFPAQKATTLQTSSLKNATATALKPVTINLKVVEHVMQFDKKTITVKAGQPVIINLENPDFMQHNLVIVKPGSLEKVGAAADQMARDPKGAEKHYVPQLPEVLFSTKLINPEEEAILQFTAPSQPGNYPFVCTFPGHWRIMNGIMQVIK